MCKVKQLHALNGRSCHVYKHIYIRIVNFIQIQIYSRINGHIKIYKRCGDATNNMAFVSHKNTLQIP